MARNQEKAQSMMNRYLKGKQEEASGPKKLRPFLASECTDLHEADRWHHQIIREVSRKVSEIQNAGLGEHRCVMCSITSARQPVLRCNRDRVTRILQFFTSNNGTTDTCSLFLFSMAQFAIVSLWPFAHHR